MADNGTKITLNWTQILRWLFMALLGLFLWIARGYAEKVDKLISDKHSADSVLAVSLLRIENTINSDRRQGAVMDSIILANLKEIKEEMRR